MKLFEVLDAKKAARRKYMNIETKANERISKILQKVHKYCVKCVNDGILDERFLGAKTVREILKVGDLIVGKEENDFDFAVCIGTNINRDKNKDRLTGDFLFFDRNGNEQSDHYVGNHSVILGNLIIGIKASDV